MLDQRGVLVVVGIGAMGLATARRCGSGARVVLADVSVPALDAAASGLAAEGHDVTVHRTDVADAASVDALAAAAAALGPVRAVVHTAGVSPVQASGERVVAIDLLGAAHMLDAFGGVVAPGGAGVVIASMSAHLAPPPSPDDETAIAGADVSDLASLPCVRAAASGDAGLAYAFAKRAVIVRVAAASGAWGQRGARVNSISPGVIATPMGQAELDGPSGAFMRTMVDSSATQRLGTPDDIASAAEFLLSDRAAFITGTDLLVDGGVVAAMRSGQVDFGTS
jgi:NAD(P)-dependent dehydrogenase (short-subunit alcohol dehydrogenase family)